MYASTSCYCFNKPEKPEHKKMGRSDFSRRVCSERTMSLNHNNNISPINSPKMMSTNSNYFFSNKWRSSKEVIDMKLALNTHTMPQSAQNNAKVLELMGVKTRINDNENKDIDISCVPVIPPRFRTFSTESITTRHAAGSLSSFMGDSEHIIENNVNISRFHIQSMSDPFAIDCKSKLQSIPSNQPIDENININNNNNELPKYNPSMIGIHHQSQSTTAIMSRNINTNEQQQQSQSQHLLTPINKLVKSNKKRKKSKSFMMKITSFMDKFKIKSDDTSQLLPIDVKNKNCAKLFSSFDTLDIMDSEKKLDNICSFSDPLTSTHQMEKKKITKKKRACSGPPVKLHCDKQKEEQNGNEIKVDFIDGIESTSFISTKL